MKKDHEELIVKFLDTLTSTKQIREISQTEVEKRLDRQESETTKIMNILVAVILVLLVMVAGMLVDAWKFKANSYQGWMEVCRKENLIENNNYLRKIDEDISSTKDSINQLSEVSEKQKILIESIN